MKTINWGIGLTVISLISIRVLFLPSNACAASSYSFSGTVKTADSLPSSIATARIHGYSASDKSKYYTAASDSAGNYSLQGIIAGPSDKIILSCSFDGYQTQERIISAANYPNGYGTINFKLTREMDWPMFKGNVSRTGSNHKEKGLVPPFSLYWSFYDGYRSSVESSPVIYCGKLYVCNYGVKCFSLKSGKLLWDREDTSENYDNYVWSTPCVAGGKIYVASFTNLYCYDANTGNELWKLFSSNLSGGGRYFRASPVIVNNTLYIGTYNYYGQNKFHSIDPATGNIKSSVSLNGGLYGSPAAEGNMIYIVDTIEGSSVGGRIICLDVSNPYTMREVWHRDVSVNEDVFSTPAVYNDFLYYSTNLSVISLNRYTGEAVSVYNYPVADSIGTINSLSVHGGNIYVSTAGNIYCLNLQRLNDGQAHTDPLVWTYQLPPGRGFFNSSLTIANGYLYFGVGDMKEAAFYCLNASSGKEEWYYDHNGDGMGYALSTPAVSDGRVVFVSAHDYPWSGIYCFGRKDTTAPTTPVVSDNGQYTEKKDQLYASWVSSDPESGISGYQYKITQDSPSGTAVCNWTSTGTTPYVTAGGLSLINGKTYYFSVRTRNWLGLVSNIGYSDGIIVKLTSGLNVSATQINLTLSKDYSSATGYTFANAFTITNADSAVTGWQLYNNQDGKYTPPGGSPVSVAVQGFGFYESSGGISLGRTLTIRAYVNNNKAIGLYQGSYILKEIGSTTKDVCVISYTLKVE